MCTYYNTEDTDDTEDTGDTENTQCEVILYCGMIYWLCFKQSTTLIR